MTPALAAQTTGTYYLAALQVGRLGMPDWVLSSGSHKADSEVWMGLRSHLELFPAPVLVAKCSSLRSGGWGAHLTLAGSWALLSAPRTCQYSLSRSPPLSPKPAIENLPDIVSSLILCIFPTSGNAQSL